MSTISKVGSDATKTALDVVLAIRASLVEEAVLTNPGIFLVGVVFMGTDSRSGLHDSIPSPRDESETETIIKL